MNRIAGVTVALMLTQDRKKAKTSDSEFWNLTFEHRLGGKGDD